MYYEINEATARTAHYNVHMSDYKPNQSTNEYRAAVDEVAELVRQQKEKTSQFYHEKLDALLDNYAARMAKWTNEYNANEAKYPSSFIAGPANYNMRKHNAQMSRESTLWKEYDEIQSIKRKIQSIGSGAVDLADPNARAMLQDQLERTKAEHEKGKALNAYYKKYGTFSGFPGMTEQEAEEKNKSFEDLKKRCPYIDKIYPDFHAANIRAKIKRLEERLQELDRRQEKGKQENQAFNGGEIIRNAEENRLQIVFDEIPAPEIRTLLKSNGFKWSPKNQAWQRQLTDNAERAAERILKEL